MITGKFLPKVVGVAALLTLAATGGHAAAYGHRHQARHVRYHYRMKPTRVRPMRLSALGTARAPRRAPEVAAAPPPSSAPRLRVDQRWGANGASSVGYERLGASPLDAHDVNAAAGTQFGAPAAVVGGAVSYHF